MSLFGAKNSTLDWENNRDESRPYRSLVGIETTLTAP